MPTDETTLEPSETWSNGTLDNLERLIRQLKDRIPALDDLLEYTVARGSSPGTDLHLSLQQPGSQITHHLRFEVEQYASGPREPLQRKIAGWASRHSEQSNTTTVVISLVLIAMRNRLIGDFSENESIKGMVRSPKFRIFPGRGDGAISHEVEEFITQWVEKHLG